MAGLITGCATDAGSRGPLSEDERRSIPGQIAFISEGAGQADIYVIDPDGRGLRRLTQGPSAEYPVEMMAGDSMLLALSVTVDSLGHREQLLSVPLDTTKAPRALGVSSHRMRYPNVIKGRQWAIVAANFNSFRDLYQISLTSDSLRRLTNNEEGNFEPHVSPNGRYVAFASSRDRNSEIYRMNADGSNQERLTHFFRDDWRPRWSPDGETIAFLSDRVVEKDRIFLMDANGDHQRQLNMYADTTKQDSIRYAWQEAQHVWSPTGEEIAYVRQRFQGPSQIWVANIASGEQRRLSPENARDNFPVWSPEGNYLVFVSGESGEADLYLVRANGTGRKRLTNAPGDDWLPRWLETGPSQYYSPGTSDR